MSDCPRLPLYPPPSSQPWAFSLAAPRAQSVDVAFQSPCILASRPYSTGAGCTLQVQSGTAH
eukprot:2294745-Pyramimonas_sp.AAC.1